MTNDEVKQIMAEAGPLDDKITGVAEVADNRWAIAFQDGEVDLELAEDGERLVVTAPIATLPDRAAEPVMQALLAYTVLWRETGGVRAALPDRTEPAVLIVDLPAAKLTPRFLADAARDMADKAAAWRVFFASAQAGEHGARPLAGGETMIRI